MDEQRLEIGKLIDKYGDHTLQAIQENHSLANLYALSGIRENLLEWYPFKKNGNILLVGSECGALTGLLGMRAGTLTVVDPSAKDLDVNRKRWGKEQNITYICGEIADCDTDYDYIILAGSAAGDMTKAVKEAEKRLAADGKMIMAVCNTYGMKYWAGAARDENHLSKNKIQTLFSGKGFLTWYYPMPDYKMPSVIYSDARFPVKGDLTDTLTIYDYPEYLLFDVGERYDEVCEDGAFSEYANSYLVVFSRVPEKSDTQTIFVKYNSTRKPEFQIRTDICIKDGKKRVLKSAMTLQGAPHIWSFSEKYHNLSSQYKNLRVLPPVFSRDKNTAEFSYLEGKSVSETLGFAIRDGKIAENEILKALSLVFDVDKDCCRDFVLSEEFHAVFGTCDGMKELENKEKSFLHTNVDALFENLMETDDGIYCMDYEWVYDFPIPCGFLKYRILYYFYRRYASILKDTGVSEFLMQYGIEPNEEKIYEEMERNFQNYVHGDVQRVLQEDFLVHTKTVRDLAHADRELARAREHEEQLKARIEIQETQINKQQEVKRLTDNHVTNLESMIRDLRHEIGEMGKTLTYLNRHEALIYKARRKAGAIFNEKYPRGSIKRKKLGYLRQAVFHPAASYKLHHTAEGRNLVEGDFKIGDIYRENGKLKFKTEENPLVSIIIPVYNQIQYTYACLLSILKYTEDVSYEIIIADDVSTDATMQLSDFAEGIVIKRNRTNQGFLRNCNQAATAARGKYLMFLNNDTQVTDGWLSALVKLIESDESIGMTGSKLVYPDGRLQEAGGIIWSDGSGWNYGRLDDPDKAEYNYVKDVDYISGAAILLPVSLWKQIGGFDTRFAPAYCEDSDLAFEVRKAGKRVVYQPLSKVIHFEGISNGTDVSGSGLKKYQVENSRKLREKWEKEFSLQCENNGNPDPFRARERSMGKKIILVVDHYVPTFDQDAGSRTTFQYLKMFLEKGYVVKFLGDNFLHEEPYSTVLQQMGIEILYGTEYQTGIWDWIRNHGNEITAAYLNRPHIASRYIDYIKDHTNMKVIYYGHDLHFLRESREYALTGDIKKRQEAEYWKSVELSLMYKADISYYPSSVECDEIHAIDPDIKVKAITAYVYDHYMDLSDADFSKREGILFVGGFAHPPNEDAVRWFTEKIYPLIRKKADIPFYVAGSRVPDDIKALEKPGNGIHILGFVSDQKLEELYRTSRMVVVPLRYGAGVKGKVIEALYNGAPVITTAVGAEGIPEAEQVMVIEDDPVAFAEKTVMLYRDTVKLSYMSAETQTYIRRQFSVDAAWAKIQKDF